MRPTYIWVLLAGMCSACSGCAGDGPVAAAVPSSMGGRVLAEAITALRGEALGRERVDWNRLEGELAARLPKNATSEEAGPLVREALAALGDPHARFIAAAKPATEGTGAASAAVSTTSAPAHPPIPTVMVGELAEDSTAYVLVPGTGMGGPREWAEYADAGRAAIASLEARHPAGWIIDLRLNGGGSVWPMLLGVSAVLGDGVQFTSVVPGVGVTQRFGLSGGEAWLNAGAGPKTQMGISREMRPAIGVAPAPVAVLVGPWTMSSGEAIAIALRSRPGVRMFGECSAGLTTVTQTYTLADGSTLILPAAQMGDVRGHPAEGKVCPDQPVAFENWPGSGDGVCLAAREWIARAREGRTR